MNRRNFFRKGGAVIAGIVITPIVITKVKREGYMNIEWPEDVPGFNTKALDERIKLLKEEMLEDMINYGECHINTELYKRYGDQTLSSALIEKSFGNG